MSIFSYIGCELNNKYYLEDTYYPKQRSLKTTEEIWNKSYPEEKMNIENFGEDVNLDIRYEQKSQYEYSLQQLSDRENSTIMWRCHITGTNSSYSMVLTGTDLIVRFSLFEKTGIKMEGNVFRVD